MTGIQPASPKLPAFCVKHAANAAFFGALLLGYYLVSYASSHVQEKPPGSTYMAICIVLANVVNAIVGVFAWALPKWTRLARILRILAGVCLVAIAALQTYYAAAWTYTTPDWRMVIPYRLTKEILLGTHLSLLALLFAILLTARTTPPTSSLKLRDYGLLSFCFLPLITYHSGNLDYFTPRASLAYFAVFGIVPVGLMTIVKHLQRLGGVSLDTAPIVAGMAWMFYARASISSALERPIESSVFAMLGILVGALLVLSVGYARQPRWMTMAGIGLVLVTIAQSYVFRPASETSRGGLSGQTSQTQIPGYLSGPFQKKPDVYFLVFDGYSTEQVLGLQGIENGRQMQLLKDKGFVFYDKTYTVALVSKPSISRVLDMASPTARAIGGNNLVNAVLQREGYRTHLVLTPYFLYDTQVFGADQIFPDRSQGDALTALYKGLLAGEFKAEFVFTFTSRLGRDEWLAKKRDVLGSRTVYPKFLYAHSPYPSHSQFSGQCLENENELFAQRLTLANEEMRDDIDAILNSQRDAIIVIAGDHGPFLTGDCFQLWGWDPSRVTAAELVDRYGVFLAIRWPDSLPLRFDEIAVLQDLFFAVFATLKGDAKVMLERPDWETQGFGPTLPAGAIKRGVIEFGRDKGKPLYLVEPRP